MRIVFIHSTYPAEAHRIHLRCVNLSRAINRLPQHHADLLTFNEFIQNTPAAEKACQAADVIVLHRHLYPAVVNSVYYWKARDKKIIIDVDISIETLMAEPESFAHLHNSLPVNKQPRIDKLEQFRLSLRLADAITVPTARLAHEYQTYAQTMIIPDAINTDEYLTPRVPDPSSRIWLGLGGEEINPCSLVSTGLHTALQHVCALRPQVGVLMAGVNKMAEVELLPDLAEDRKKIIPEVSFEQWIRLLAGVDIGLAPICPRQENHWSSIRVLEYMAMKIPWVASDNAPYQSVKRYGWITGNTVEAWEYILLELIDHLPVYRAEASGESFIVALGQDVNENIATTIHAYQSVIA